MSHRSNTDETQKKESLSMRFFCVRSVFHLWLTILVVAGGANAGPPVSIAEKANSLEIAREGKPFASYVFRDEQVLRPYLARVHAPNGVQVTRTHPPVTGKDATDHATMHPGVWLAFGDMSSADFWRNRGTVKHVRFVDPPKSDRNGASFTALNRYEAGGKTICEERRHITIRPQPSGTLLLWDSRFTADTDFYFGDQEEMGFGVRVATPLAVQKGGAIVDSAGRKNERQVWGQQADWCAYRGTIDGKSAGVAIMPHPDNFRRAWFHARDYGLLVANPFGQRAFTKGAASKVHVKAGETFRLRFGLLVFTGDPDLNAAFREYAAQIVE
jgi:hypothetical protein